MHLTQLPQFPAFPKIFRGKIIDVAEAFCCLEESGQWLENVDKTHLVLASGKTVNQKGLKCTSSSAHASYFAPKVMTTSIELLFKSKFTTDINGYVKEKPRLVTTESIFLF